MTTEVTALLRRWREGDSQALDRLVPLVYPELRRLARRFLQRERPNHTLAPTALVHEAYLRLADKDHPKWQDRIHFYAVAAQLMRRILVDHARSRATAKRGGDVLQVPLDEARDQAAERTTDLLALDDALNRLEGQDPRKSRIIELRYFGGLTLEETAQFLEISVPTVVKEARMARAWLYSQMSGAEETG
jgi:RNA polymerase sigma factor (TIGR02999 family)